VRVLHMYAVMTCKIALLTGRPEKYRKITENWLQQYDIPWDSLVMRPDNDRTDDHLFKTMHLRRWLHEGFTIYGLYEDRKRICEAARRMDITVFQVANGDF
jgi:hypothetical protein